MLGGIYFDGGAVGSPDDFGRPPLGQAGHIPWPLITVVIICFRALKHDDRQANW